MTASAPRRTRRAFALAVAGAALVTLHAQTPQAPASAPTAAPAPPTAGEQTPVFRAGVEVLPLDAVVLDHDGRQVTDLTAAEFRVEVDGHLASATSSRQPARS